MVRKLHSTPAEVYAAWTEPELFARWLTDDSDAICTLTLDARKGGRFRLEGVHGDGSPFSFAGTYLQIIEERRVAFSWDYDGPNRAMNSGPSVVIAEFRPLGRGVTELSVTHQLLAKQESGSSRSEFPFFNCKRDEPDHHADPCCSSI